MKPRTAIRRVFPGERIRDYRQSDGADGSERFFEFRIDPGSEAFAGAWVESSQVIALGALTGGKNVVVGRMNERTEQGVTVVVYDPIELETVRR